MLYIHFSTEKDLYTILKFIIVFNGYDFSFGT